MLTDLDCAQLIAAQYAGDRTAFDLFIDPQHNDWAGVAWAVKHFGTVSVVALEGSHDPPDWAKDFRFLPVYQDGVSLHRGFFEDMSATWRAIAKACPSERLIFCGHSLGAARADILAWLAMQEGRAPCAYIRWGEPAPAYGPSFGAALAGLPGRSYRNVKPGPRHANEVDLITEMPPAILDARHPQRFTDLYAPPWGAASDWGLLSWHHFGLYLSVTPATVIVP